MISCPICLNPDPLLLPGWDSFKVHKCRNCELIWVPGVGEDVLKKFYTEKYFKSTDSTLGYHDYIEDEEILRLNARYILSNIPSARRGGKILDVGCAHGFFLDEARKLGCEPHGVELSRDAVEYARKKLNLDVFNGTLEQSPFQPSTFDIALIIGSIEHFPDPISIIEKVEKLLKPGGYLAITTINTKGLVRLYDIKPPEHLYYFSAKNLRMLLESRGYEVVRTAPYWCHYHLNEALCRAFRLVFGSGFRIENFLSSFPFMKACMKVPTNEMFMLSRKETAEAGVPPLPKAAPAGAR